MGSRIDRLAIASLAYEGMLQMWLVSATQYLFFGPYSSAQWDCEVGGRSVGTGYLGPKGGNEGKGPPEIDCGAANEYTNQEIYLSIYQDSSRVCA